MALARQLPSSVELVVAGAGQSESYPPPEFRERSNVTLLEGVPHDKMPDFYRSVDVLLETHTLDIFGLNVIEAMACGRPVIRAKGGYRYPVVDGVTGFLVDPSPESFAGKITDITKNPQGLRDMGLKARSLIEKEFSSEKMCNRIKAIYEEVAG